MSSWRRTEWGLHGSQGMHFTQWGPLEPFHAMGTQAIGTIWNPLKPDIFILVPESVKPNEFIIIPEPIGTNWKS